MTLNEMLLRLHRRLGISTGAQDELLTDLLADANALMLAYLNRAELPEKERALAMAELALDYLKSGMYDRGAGKRAVSAGRAALQPPGYGGRARAARAA